MEQLLEQLLKWAIQIKNQTQVEGNTSTMVGSGLENLIGAVSDLQKNKADNEALATLNKELQNISVKFKGYHLTVDALNNAYPKTGNKKDDYAWVGTPYPGTVHKIEQDGGAWTDMKVAPSQPIVELDEYAKKKDLNGEKVVYTPDGKLSSKNVKHGNDNVEEILDGIGYKIEGVIENKDNLFPINTFSATNERYSDIDGKIQGNAVGYSATAKFDLALPVGTKLRVNTNQTIVFYSRNGTILYFEKSLSDIPKNEKREIILQQSGIALMSFTFLTEWGKQNMYVQNASEDVYQIGGIPSKSITHDGKRVEEILNGIAYQFKIDETIDSPNLFPENARSYTGRRYSDITGLEMTGYPDYSIVEPFAFAPKVGDVLLINSNQTIVFYTDNLNAVHGFIPSISEIPALEPREIVITQEGIKNMSFTFLTSLGRENIYVKYRKINKETAGVPVKNIVLDDNSTTLSEYIKSTPKYKKGLPFKEKKKIEFSEVAGIVGLLGNIANSTTGIIAKSKENLEPNSVYYVELDDVITGFICATVGGYPLVIAGRKKFYFKTNERENQEFAMWVKGDQEVSYIPVLFDVRGKYRMYKLEQPTEVKGIPNLPAVANDLSAFPSARIAEPEFVIWNVIGNYHALTATAEYSEEPIEVEYLDSNGNYFKKFAVMAGQGRSSMTFENHNAKFKLMNRDGSKFYLTIGDLLPRSTFHFKVNFSDFAQLNNPATPEFITDWYRDEKDKKFVYPWLGAYPIDLSKVQLKRAFDKRPRGIIKAIPTSICTLWNHRSCGTMNLNAFAENFYLDPDNPLHRGFRGDLDDRNKDRWEEMCSDTEGEEMTEETWTPFANWYAWIRANASSSKIQEFRAGDGVKFDASNLIDTWLLAEWFFLSDNLQANQVWVTYNSVKFTYMWYDLDSAFGQLFNGKVEFKPTDTYTPNRQAVALWEQVKRAYKDELKERYIELRKSGRFSIEKVREIYGKYHSRFDYEWFEMDFHTFRTRNSIQEGSFASLERVFWFAEERLKFLDQKYGYK